MPYFGHESDKGCRGFVYGTAVLAAVSLALACFAGCQR